MSTGSALREAVDALQELDPATLSDTELEALALEVDRQHDRLGAAHARILAAVAAYQGKEYRFPFALRLLK